MQSLKIIPPLEFKNQHFEAIHTEALRAARNLKEHYIKLFEILLIIEARQIYYQFELTRLHTYCVELLELSPNVAKDFVNVVRTSLKTPQLAEAIRTGRVSISKARKICPVINDKNHDEWIDLAASCTARVIEKCVADANPKPASKESIEYVTASTLEVRMDVSEECAELLTRTKDLLAQKLGRHVTTSEALFNLMSEFCMENDPVEKAKRAQSKLESKIGGENVRGMDTKEPTIHAEISQVARTRYRQVKVEHEVDLRDQGQCTYLDRTGKRCESKRWLHKHHIKPFSEGGPHTADNLETLCSGHHKIRHLIRSQSNLKLRNDCL